MNIQASTGEHDFSENDIMGGSQMDNRAAEIIRECKAIRAEGKITYIEIMEQMEENNSASVVSLSTLRRVFRDGSEIKANSFHYEEILIPIRQAMLSLAKKPRPVSEHDKELEGYKAVIRVQNEELDRLIELKEHLERRIEFMAEQIERKDRRMDEKDEIIRQLMAKIL